MPIMEPPDPFQDFVKKFELSKQAIEQTSSEVKELFLKHEKLDAKAQTMRGQI